MRLTRRAALSSLGLAGLAGASRSFRFAICNETFEGKTFAEACRLARATGYEGIEIAPGTLSGDPAAIPMGRRTELRRVMNDEGIRYAGMHALVSVPSDLHLTTPDDAVRTRSWQYFDRLIDLAADLGGGSFMALGSGKQRGIVSGSSVPDAAKRLRDGLAGAASRARERNVLILLEPLSPQFTNVVNTLGEAVAIVREVNSPALSSMFDTHNTASETEPHDQLIRKYANYIRHVHLNEMDGRYPGTGTYDFRLVLDTLKQLRYSGWVSLEVFDFRPSGDVVARETMTLLRKITADLGGTDK